MEHYQVLHHQVIPKHLVHILDIHITLTMQEDLHHLLHDIYMVDPVLVIVAIIILHHHLILHNHLDQDSHGHLIKKRRYVYNIIYHLMTDIT